jgi:hypothetical protein
MLEYDSKYFTVKGTLACGVLCSCIHCQGHTHEHVVKETVLASSACEAKSRVMKLVMDHFDYMDAKWVHPPSVTSKPLPPDERMRLVGAPTLPGLADVCLAAKGGSS